MNVAHRTKPIRVLLIAPSMGITGGQAVQAQRLLAELLQEHDVAVTFFATDLRLPSWVADKRYVRTVFRFLLYLPRLFALALRNDVLHVFSASYWAYVLCTLPAILEGRVLGKKVIVNYRSGEAEDHLAHWRSAIPTLRLAHTIVSPGEYLVDVFARFGLHIRCIPNILETSAFVRRPRRRLRPVFLTNRGLEPLYNVGCILRAFQIIQQRYPDATLTIAHDGICRPQLEALARQLELRNARFIGRVPYERIRELYNEADIYLTSPNLDCLPGSILECYASGLPVIATRAGGIPYILRHEETGLLVDLNDHEGMAQCAFRLLEDEELAERLAGNAFRECEKYRGEPVRKAWVALYRELLGAG
jgi:glycosyltransferase involved in cell wall biosynthesis